MKHAVEKHLADGASCWYESIHYWERLRVDVQYYRKHRLYMYECETKPKIPRLKMKGIKRQELRERNVYSLVVPADEYHRIDTRELSGYFDRILSYDPETQNFVDKHDLRFMGALREQALDLVVPVYHNEIIHFIIKLPVRLRNTLKLKCRLVVQCGLCKLGFKTPWTFCPRMDCKDSVLFSRNTQRYETSSPFFP